MAPLAPRPGHGLLRCPICALDLATRGNALACDNRHSFDLAREGYVNLLSGRRRRAAEGGDTAEQLRHRASFLDSGHFAPFTEIIAQHLCARGDQPSPGPLRVLDAGSGTGHHLARIVAKLRAPAVGLGLDLSAAAARHAARRWPEHAFAVADLWRDWPMHDAAADLVLSIFAPKNFAETARVLRPSGWLALIYPGPEHLAELARRFRLMRQDERKAERYIEAIARSIGSPTMLRHHQATVLDSRAIRDLVLMGPNAHHLSASTFDTEPEPLAVTIDVVILMARASS